MRKFIYIPGWLDKASNHGIENGIDIWHKKVDIKIDANIDFIVGRSLGANLAILNWQQNKAAKLILINPVVLKYSIWFWLKRWIKYAHEEDINFPVSSINFWRLPINIIKCVKLLSQNYGKVLAEIPREKIIVLRGSLDNYFCDQETANYLRSKNIELIEVENRGHNQYQEFSDIFMGLING